MDCKPILKVVLVCAEERVKKDVNENEQLIFKNMQKYETEQLKTKPTASEKSTASFAKRTFTQTKPIGM